MNKQRKRLSGFTMIETAIVLAIVGIIISGAAIAFPRYVYQLQVAETNKQMDTVMNVLSVYAQRHNRLPCPALSTGDGSENKPITSGTTASCYDNSSAAALYSGTQGVLPWRELGIPVSMTRDAWGRQITYKPAAQLTLDTSADTMQHTTGAIDPANDLDIHNACRTSMWYTLDAATGNPIHTNRAQALFCCNAPAKAAYMPGGAAANWRNQSLRAAGQDANGSVIQTAAFMDRDSDSYVNGTFSLPRLSGFNNQLQALADSPMIRASTNAVTLISHGNNGLLAYILGTSGLQQSGSGMIAAAEQANATDYANTSGTVYNAKLSGTSYDRAGQRANASDDVVVYMRSDQLYAKAGRASCQPQMQTHSCAAATTTAGKPLKNTSFVLDKSGSMSATTACMPGSPYCGMTLNDVVDNAMQNIIPKEIDLKQQAAALLPPGTPADTIQLATINPNQTPPSAVTIDMVNTVSSGNNTSVNTLLSQLNTLTPMGYSPIAQGVLNMADSMGDGDSTRPNVVILLSDGQNNRDVSVPAYVDKQGNNVPAQTYHSNGSTPTNGTPAMKAVADYIGATYPHLQIYTVLTTGLGGQLSSSQQKFAKAGADAMQYLADQTGGKFMRVNYPEDLNDIFDSIITSSQQTCL